MGIVDKLLGREEEEQPRRGGAVSGQNADQQALARYRYMLQTAPPETIEQAHAEAFAKLTPEQRQMVLQELSGAVPESERGAAGADPQQLARMATRAEVRQPGILERTFGGMGGGGMGFGGMMAGSFLSSMAGVVVGSMIAQQFLGDAGFGAGDAGDQYGADNEQGNDEQEAGADADAGSEMDAGDFGGDMGDF